MVIFIGFLCLTAAIVMMVKLQEITSVPFIPETPDTPAVTTSIPEDSRVARPIIYPSHPS